MRWILILAIAVFLIAFAQRIATWSRGLPSRPAQRDELVKDPVCQTYVVMSRAIKKHTDDGTVHFCSRECADRYARGERRA